MNFIWSVAGGGEAWPVFRSLVKSYGSSSTPSGSDTKQQSTGKAETHPNKFAPSEDKLAAQYAYRKAKGLYNSIWSRNCGSFSRLLMRKSTYG